MTLEQQELKVRLSNLNLNYLARNIDDFIARCTKKQLSPFEIIEQMAELEQREHSDKLVASRISAAKLLRFKPMIDFDWSWPTKIPKQTIERLFDLTFLEEPKNVILIGSSGCGKTMIAKNLGYQAAKAANTVFFTDASDLITDLSVESQLLFKRRLAKYIRPKLLIIDELGYLSYTAKSADIIFQVVNKRHEVHSTIVTTNKPFSEWSSVFPGAGCVVALIDRLVQNSEVLLIEARESYRKKNSEENIKRRKDLNNDRTKKES